MIDKLLLHPKTRLQIENMSNTPPHAILVVGRSGSGKKTLSKSIAHKLLKLEAEQDVHSYPYFIHVTRHKNKSDISIDQVREIISALKLKAPGTKSVRRVVFVEDAQYLSIPAQNSLLKILEEPSQETIFILSTDSIQNILPTIQSRTQSLEIYPVKLAETLQYLGSDYPQKEIESAWRLSGGTAGLIHALLNESAEHPLKIAIDDAKNFLKSNKYERLLRADQMGKNREQLSMFLDALSRTLSALHHIAIRSGKDIQASNLLLSRKLLSESERSLEANANSRLIMLRLVLGLKI